MVNRFFLLYENKHIGNYEKERLTEEYYGIIKRMLRRTEILLVLFRKILYHITDNSR